MKQLLLSLGVWSLMSTSLFGQSRQQNFNFGWRFLEQDVSGAQHSTFDDSQWQRVNLPHDWDIYHAPKADAATRWGGGYFPGGIGWYRKQVEGKDLRVSASQSLWLHFEGVYENCTVYVNGKQAGTHAYGYTPFKINITSYITEGTNTIAVRVNNSQQPNCRWYSGSGIYRHVWLETYDENKMDDPQKLFVRTEKVYGISSDGSHADSAAVRITYADKHDEVRMLRNVNLWSPKHPALYDIQVGEMKVKHGVRTIEYDAQRGFLLNGQPTLINGACVHHDNGVIGAMAFDAAEIRKVKLMKEAGFNLIRTSHNPQTRAMLDACDSIGMMVVDESFDGWYTEKNPYDYHLVIDSCYTEDLTAMVLRDRNHPSIISYSIGNEIIERKEIRVIHTAQKFKNVITALDNTRPVTEALCAWDSDWDIFDPHAAVLDIVGYNYMIHKAEGDHKRCPERVIWQTESYPRNAFSNWKHTMEHPYIIGDMVWTGLDYLGESGIGMYHYEGEPRQESWQAEHFPYHGAYCGDVDVTGWRKPISHYRSMLWNTPEGSPDLYLSVREPDYYYNGHISETMWSTWPTWESWNWSGHEGKNIEVEIYTKAPKVRLYLNGKMVAEKAVSFDTQYKAVISLPYQPGTLRAVSLDTNDKEMQERILQTSGEPASLRLVADRKHILANGEDLAYLTLEVVDKDGQFVPDASIPVTVTVEGKATLLSAATANLRDLEPKTSPKVTTYKGRALIVVRSGKKAGEAIVSAVSDKVKKPARSVVKVK
ncbi:MAG: glycoside hydrolase family 2 protein [Bacteroidales bacterium]|nr:glycoside hydrolase family 2 protein [Bacteroidales bacterium]